MHPALLEDRFDLFRSDQRPRCIVDSNVPCRWLEMIQSGADGILTMFATGNDRLNFFEIFIADERFDFSVSIFTCNHNDFVDTAGPLKCADGMEDDRSIGDRRKQFVETHAATVTGGDEDGCKHRQKLKGYKAGAGEKNSLF